MTKVIKGARLFFDGKEVPIDGSVEYQEHEPEGRDLGGGRFEVELEATIVGSAVPDFWAWIKAAVREDEQRARRWGQLTDALAREGQREPKWRRLKASWYSIQSQIVTHWLARIEVGDLAGSHRTLRRLRLASRRVVHALEKLRTAELSARAVTKAIANGETRGVHAELGMLGVGPTLSMGRSEDGKPS